MKKIAVRKYLSLFALPVLFMVISIACQSVNSTNNVVFDSGEGMESNDSKTYDQYESKITFTPQVNLTAKSINPKINYCNGSCGYIVCVLKDQIAGPIACQTGSIDANNQIDPQFPKRYLESQIQFIRGEEYHICIRVWTTKSVGIYTTGTRKTGIIGKGNIRVDYARSEVPFMGIPPNDNLDRGGISFQIIN
jgi:hypothetical protein